MYSVFHVLRGERGNMFLVKNEENIDWVRNTSRGKLVTNAGKCECFCHKVDRVLFTDVLMYDYK